MVNFEIILESNIDADTVFNPLMLTAAYKYNLVTASIFQWYLSN